MAQSDGANLLIPAIVSIAEAFIGVKKGLYTWSTVKLYYSTFYIAKSILLLNRVNIYYDGRKPYSWLLSEGSTPKPAPKKVGGSSHAFVLHAFQQHFPNSPLLSQEIEGVNAFEWLKTLRETVHYKNRSFTEPNTPEYFEKAANFDLRILIEDYFHDSVHAFDADHAALSFPIYAFKYALGSIPRDYAANGVEVKKFKDLDYVMSDKKGKIRRLIDMKDAIYSSESRDILLGNPR